MARKRLHKVMIDEVLRLKRLGFSQRKIARQLGVARGTVQKYWHGDEEKEVSNEPNWVQKVDWVYLEAEINKGITRKVLFQEVKELVSIPSCLLYTSPSPRD